MTEKPTFTSPELVRRITELNIDPPIQETSLQWAPQIGQETQVACFFPGGSVGLKHPLLQDLQRLTSPSASCLLAQFPHHEDPRLNDDKIKRFTLGQARALAIAESVIEYSKGKPSLLGGKSIGGVHALTVAARLTERGIFVPHVYLFGVPLRTLSDVMKSALVTYGKSGGKVHGFHAQDDDYGTPDQVNDFFESTGCQFTLDLVHDGGHNLGYGDPVNLPVSESAIEELRQAFVVRLQK